MLSIAIVAPMINPGNLWIPAFFGLTYPYIAAITIVGAFIIMFFNTKKSIVPILVFLLGIGPCRHTFHFSGTRNHFSEQEKDLKILSQNVHLFGVYNSNGKLTSDSVLQLIEKEKPDIACFQEFYNQDKVSNKTIQDFMQAGLFSNYYVQPYSTVGKDGYFGIITFSRFPVINQGEVKNPVKSGKKICAIWCDVIIKTDTVRIYNIHLQSIGFTSTEESLFAEKNNQDEIEYKSKSTVRKLKRAFVNRSMQIEALVDHIAQCPYPKFLIGDFNDTPVSYTYRKLRYNLRDAFLDSGPWGMGKTYNGPFPSVRIDYIFYPTLYDAAGFNILKKQYSDHFPITCRFKKLQ
jgi:endonuclease/exonuclease/phosphatase family metal-dependent hydrolase